MVTKNIIEESRDLENRINEKYFMLSEEGFPIADSRFEDQTPPPVENLNVRDPEKIENMNTFWAATVYPYNVYLRAIYLALRGDILEALDLEKKWENRIKECYPKVSFDSPVPFGRMEAKWIPQGRFNSKLMFDRWTLERKKVYFSCSPDIYDRIYNSLSTTALKAIFYHVTKRGTDKLKTLENYITSKKPEELLVNHGRFDGIFILGTFYALSNNWDKLKEIDEMISRFWTNKTEGNVVYFDYFNGKETLPGGVIREEIVPFKQKNLWGKTKEGYSVHYILEHKYNYFFSSQVFSWQIFLSARGKESSHIYDRWKSIGGLNKDGLPYARLEKSTGGGFTLPFGMDKKPEKQDFFADDFYLMLIADLVSKKGFY